MKLSKNPSHPQKFACSSTYAEKHVFLYLLLEQILGLCLDENISMWDETLIKCSYMQAWILLRCDKKWLAGLLKFYKRFHTNRHITESHRRSQGTGGHAPPKFLGYLVILCFEKRCLKQKYCCSPKIKHFGLPNLWPTKNFVLATPLLNQGKNVCYKGISSHVQIFLLLQNDKQF